MLNSIKFCNIVNRMLNHNSFMHSDLFTNVDSICFVHNHGFLKLDYCTYYNAKLKNMLAIVNRMRNKCSKLQRL